MAKKQTDEELRKMGFKQYLKIVPIWAKQMDVPFKCNTKEGDNIRGKSGDYLAIGIEGEHWPIDQEIFKSTYKLK